jgi:hypothetical protein
LSILRATIFGRGRTELAAYGPADAEATVEKEFRNLRLEGRLDIRSLRRTEAEQHIVESFELTYSVRLTVEVEAPSSDEKALKRIAFAAGRSALEGTRFHRVEWERVLV